MGTGPFDLLINQYFSIEMALHWGLISFIFRHPYISSWLYPHYFPINLLSNGDMFLIIKFQYFIARGVTVSISTPEVELPIMSLSHHRITKRFQ
jgi:hypothetical protein